MSYPPPHLAGSIHLKSKPPSPAGSQTFFSGKDEHQHESFTVYLGSLVPACSCCSIAKLCSDVLRLYRSHLKSFQDVKPFPQYSSSNADELCILFHPFLSSHLKYLRHGRWRESGCGCCGWRCRGFGSRSSLAASQKRFLTWGVPHALTLAALKCIVATQPKNTTHQFCPPCMVTVCI